MNKNKKYVISCIDGSSFSEAVCDYSAWIARTVGAPLQFLHTIEHRDVPPVADLTGVIGLGTSEDLLNELAEVEQNRSRLRIKKGSIMLEAAKKKAYDSGLKNIECIQLHGNLTEALVDMEDQIRVVVMGIRGEQHESNQAGLGAQLEAIIRSLHKPILVVNKAFSEPKKIMLAYDGSKCADKALKMVTSSLLFKKMDCHLVHVTDAEKAADPILEEAKRQLAAANISVTSANLHGKIEEALITYRAAKEIDLTLMGAFGHTLLRKFMLGSFTAKMLERTKRPLLLLR